MAPYLFLYLAVNCQLSVRIVVELQHPLLNLWRE